MKTSVTHPFVGRWLVSIYRSNVYDVRVEHGELIISGECVIDGEKYQVSNVRWNTSSVSFEIFAKSTNYRSHILLEMKDTQPMARITFSERVTLKRSQSSTSSLSTVEPNALTCPVSLFGTWEADDDADRSGFQIYYRNQDLIVEAFDVVDKEAFEVSALRWNRDSIAFRLAVPSTGQVSDNEITIQSNVPVLVSNRTESFELVRADI